MEKVRLLENTGEIMRAHAIGTFPNECCGFFFGEIKDGNRNVTEIRPVSNSKEGDQRRRFSISPKDYLQAEKYALEQGLVLLGIYHSHPLHPAVPSVHDLKQAVPFFSYIILSVNERAVTRIRSWQLDDQSKFQEEPIQEFKPINT